MRKFVIGLIAGAFLMFSAQAFGESVSLVGKKIAGEAAVVVDGNQIGTAIIVEGRSYAPVRVVGEAAGYEVGYVAGSVTMDSKVKETAGNLSEQIPISDLIDQLMTTPIIPTGPAYVRTINDVEFDIWTLKVQLLSENLTAEQRAKLEADLAALEAEKAALEAQQ